MVVTKLVSQPLTSPLNDDAPENMPNMFVTKPVSQPLTSPLNDTAPANMPNVFVTVVGSVDGTSVKLDEEKNPRATDVMPQSPNERTAFK